MWQSRRSGRSCARLLPIVNFVPYPLMPCFSSQFAVDDGLVQKKIQYLLRSSSSRLTIRILAADTGKIVKATLGISPKQHSNEDVMQGCYAHTEGPTRISGVPGTAAPVHIETPLEGNPLPTGKELHVLDFEGEQVSCRGCAIGCISINFCRFHAPLYTLVCLAFSLLLLPSSLPINLLAQ